MMKYLSVTLSAIATAYTLWYMHLGVPWTNDGAISSIGMRHRALFTVWGVLVYAALALAVVLAFRTFHQTKLYIPLLAVCAVGMTLTVSCRFYYQYRAEYILHCGGSLAFSVVMGTTVFLLFLLGWKKHIIFKIFTFITGAILLGDIVLLCIFQETALIETVPILAGLIMLNTVILGGKRFDAARKAATAR